MGRRAFLLAFVFAVALPDHPSVLISGMPDLGAIYSPAVSADNLAGERACAGRLVIILRSPRDLRLHFPPFDRVDGRRMALRHVVLRNFTLVGFHLLLQEVHGKGLLQQRCTHIFLIGQDTLNGVWLPFLLPTGSQDSIAGQSGCNRAVCLTFHEPSVDITDSLCFFRVDFRLTVRAFAITQEVLVRHADLTVCKALPLPPGHVLGNTAALFLREAAHDRDQQVYPCCLTSLAAVFFS